MVRLVLVDPDRWGNGGKTAAADRVFEEIAKRRPRGAATPWPTDRNMATIRRALEKLGEDELMAHVRACARVAKRRPEHRRWWTVSYLLVGESSEVWRRLAADHKQEVRADNATHPIEDPDLRKLLRGHVKTEPSDQTDLFGGDDDA